MPIHGLSERRRMNRLGKIRLGVMVQPGEGKNPYPRATDHFVCPPEVQAVFGDKPKELEILFPVEDVGVIFPQALKAYKGARGKGVLWCAGDGQTARRRAEDGQLVERACPCELLDEGKCKPVATLNVLIPSVAGIGVWQISTSSKRSIVSLNSDLEMYRGLFGGLRGIPFTLRLVEEPFERWDEASKKMRPDTAHVLKLDTKRTLMEILEWRKAIGKPVEILMMPEDDDDDAPAVDGPPALTAGTPPPPAQDEPFDITRAFAEAKKLGIEREMYADYLYGVYRLDVDNIGFDALAEQADKFKAAAASRDAATQFIKGIENVAGKVREERVRR